MHRDAPHHSCALLLISFGLVACGGGGGGGAASSGGGQPPLPPAGQVSLSAPASNTLVGVNRAQNITASIANISASRLVWSVLPAGRAANATITPVSSTNTAAIVEFRASVAGTYTVKVTSTDDATKTAQLDLRVHTVYTAIDGYGQGRSFLRADGRVVVTGVGNAADATGSPADALQQIAQGESFRVGVRADGTVVSWGTAIDGDNSAPTPPPAGLAQVSKVDAGHYHAIAILMDGTLATWGRFNGFDMRLPDGYSTRKFTAAGALLGATAALEDSGSISVWNGMDGRLLSVPAAWQGRTFKTLCATQWHVIAVDAAGALFAWNALNDGDPATGTPPATSGPVAAVYCGSDNAALVQEDGRVMTWGENIGISGAFDSGTVAGFPRIKGASLYAYGEPYFLSEGGAIIDRAGNIVSSIDSL